MIFRFTTSDSSNQNANNAQPVGGRAREGGTTKKCVRSAKVNVLEGKWVEWGMSGGKGIANQLTWSRIYPLGAASFRSQFRSSAVPLRFFFFVTPHFLTLHFCHRIFNQVPAGLPLWHCLPPLSCHYTRLSVVIRHPFFLLPPPFAHGPVLSIKC